MLKINTYSICSSFYINSTSIFFKTVLLVILLTNTKSIAQVNFSPSFEKTDQLIKENKLDEAYTLMKMYQVSYPNDFITSWKTAQLAYWTWDINNARRYYLKTIRLDESNLFVKNDYAKMLFAVGDYNEAAAVFAELRKNDPNSPEIWGYSIKSYYYDNKLNKAMALFEELPESLQSNVDLYNLKRDIAILKATNINLGISYIDDNQPMKTISPTLRISKMQSSYVNWYFEGTLNTFSNDTLNSNSQTFKVGNKFDFNSLKLKADAFVGTTILPNTEKSAVIGGLFLSKKITEGVALNAELSRNPYYYSLQSTTNFVFQDNAGIALSITDIKKFSGNIQYQKQSFNDDNSITATSVWFLSPKFGSKTINAKLGYAYEAMDSENDTFSSIKSIPQIVDDFWTNPEVKGIYMDYFTPQNQKINSALLNIELKLSAKLEINLRGSYGFKAKIDNPYLFLNEDSSNQLFIDKGYISEEFNPASFKANLNYILNEKIAIGLHYDYFKTAFYSANTFMLNLNYKIISEK